MGFDIVTKGFPHLSCETTSLNAKVSEEEICSWYIFGVWFWFVKNICVLLSCMLPIFVCGSYIWNVVLVLTYVTLEIHLNFFGTLNPNNPMEFIRVVPLSCRNFNLDDTFCEDKEGGTYILSRTFIEFLPFPIFREIVVIFSPLETFFFLTCLLVSLFTHKHNTISHHLSFPLYFIYNIIIIDSGCNFCQT